jgi:hypothetical protein
MQREATEMCHYLYGYQRPFRRDAKKGITEASLKDV